MKTVAACLHGGAERFGSFGAAEEEGDEQGGDFARPLQKIAVVKTHTTRGLGFNQALYFGGENGYKFERDDKDHHERIGGNTYALEWREKRLHTIGQVDE